MSTHTQLVDTRALDRRLPTMVGAGISAVAGFLLAIFWSFEFVDEVIGGSVAGFFLGADHAADPGLVGAIAFAVVVGLAGTFTACNIACFASLGPLAAESTQHSAGRSQLVRHAAAQLLWLAAGMSLVAAGYGTMTVLAGENSLMLSDATVGGVPVRLVQASVINVGLGVGLGWIAGRYLTGRPLPGRSGTFVLGLLLGLLTVGRPFPMFREVLADATNAHPLLGVATVVLVAVGNLALVTVLFLGTVALAGPSLARFSARNRTAVLNACGFVLLGLAVFSVAYWGVRVPAIFGIGWFPGV